MSTTMGNLKRHIAANIHDPQFISVGEGLIEGFIQDAYDDIKLTGWLLPVEEDESITLVADTYSYPVPANFAYIYMILEEDYATPGQYDYAIPDNAWRPAYDGGVPVIMFNSLVWGPTAGKKIKIVGQQRPTVPLVDATAIEDGFVSFIRMRTEAYALLYLAAVPVEESTPELLEKRIAIANVRTNTANSLFALSERAVAHHPAEYRVKPSSRHIPTR